MGPDSELGLADLIDEEFRMYRYHQRLISGKPNFGWQRNIIHSLIQQIIRGDLGYWLSYVALWPDRNPCLVSYRYYRKLKSRLAHDAEIEECDQDLTKKSKRPRMEKPTIRRKWVEGVTEESDTEDESTKKARMANSIPMLFVQHADADGPTLGQ